MKCPHCTVEFHDNSYNFVIGEQYREAKDRNGVWNTSHSVCPKCQNIIIFVYCMTTQGRDKVSMAYPKGISRIPIPSEVPAQIVQDYREACLVLADSPKASAALSRRCLQHVLKEAGKTTKKDLADQINEVLPSLPQHLRELVDAVRVMGNFAAHPLKSTHTGEIIDVEPGEAELLLDVLEMAFDFYFVQPAEAKKRRDAINEKLKAAGKPPMK